MYRRLIKGSYVLALALLVALRLTAVPSYAQNGELVADLGFRPEQDGFSFQNYGNENNPTNLTSVEMIRIFGAERVCAGAVKEDGSCKLTAPAAAFMKKENADMDGGHCEGMAVLSLVFFEQALDPSAFGAASTSKLRLSRNPLLQREIAYWFQLQVMDEVYKARIVVTPAELVAGLIDAFEQGYLVTLAFYQPDGSGGHAVTPYAVRQLSDTRYDVLIYDNNFPKEERSIEIDVAANTWRYNTAANPNDPPELYEGDATTGSLVIVPLESRYQESFTCSYCGDYIPAERTGAVGKLSFSLNGEANIVITDEQGRELRYVDGTYNNAIPEAGVRFVTNQRARSVGARRAPTVILPNGKYIVRLTRKSSERPATSLTFAKQGNVISVSKLDLSQSLDIEIDPQQIKLKSAAARAMNVQNAVSAGGKHFSYNISGSGDVLTLRLNEGGQMRASGSSGSYSLLVTRTDSEGNSRIFYSSSVNLSDEGEAEFDPAEWEDALTVGYYADDGTFLEAETYTLEALSAGLLDLFDLDRDFIQNFDDEDAWDDAWGLEEEGDFGEAEADGDDQGDPSDTENDSNGGNGGRGGSDPEDDDSGRDSNG
ncbi:MAG: hypothetical protein CUN50_02425 [Candidatus Thermofonsia Clade 1 bacterium]|uniref:Uncharacterized protein n=1 Tax=Candidatus Thermofonsia Clade 1 bacterium TaxID=2364210 RepID=A0A2M8PZ90_9CHLR|nr:MAG: hypothetical protein CUN50_02425 [Candidatus Thermofonsia Clade 1 bacterium]